MQRRDGLGGRGGGKAPDVTDDRLTIHTLALRRALASGEHELSPVVAPAKFPAFVEAMRVIRVPEAPAAHAIALLEPYGQRTTPRVALDHDAARRLVELLAAFRRDTALPGKALAFVDYLATRPARPALTVGELTCAFAA
jgi:hypothetical protein